MSDSEGEEEVCLLERNTRLLSAGKDYNVQLALMRGPGRSSAVFNVKVRVQHEGDRIGFLRGRLIRRPDGNFQRCVEDTGDWELERLAATFCNSNGVASRVDHPRLKEAPQCVSSGGFLHIERVEVKPDHQGHDLGLKIIHETLVFLKNGWSLAVMEPTGLAARECKWKENSRIGERDCGIELTSEQLELIQSGSLKVCRYWARIGFVQAGRTPALHSAWFMTSDWYFPPGVSDINYSTNRWIPKTETCKIDVYVPPETIRPTGIDKELNDAVAEAIYNPKEIPVAELLLKIESLVKRGASIKKSYALHIAADMSLREDALRNDVGVLEALVRLGGNVNDACELGNTPLHMAADTMSAASISFLLKSGANLEAKNIEGHTPLECLMIAIKRIDDTFQELDLKFPPREIDIAPKLACVKALMTINTLDLLIEGWLSPKMRKRLLGSAEITYDEITSSMHGEGFETLAYIPFDAVCLNTNGIFQKFNDGWAAVFYKIAEILRRGQAPTVQRVKDNFTRNYNRNYEIFIKKGGRVEYAIDALLDISARDGGWESDGSLGGNEAVLPSTPLDGQFDIVHFMCIDRGGGVLKKLGPHRDSFGQWRRRFLEEDSDY